MRQRKHHWPSGLLVATLCGQSVVDVLMASTPGETDCLSCRRTLDEPWHGTSGGYNNHSCRCLPCKAAWAAKVADWRARHKGQEPENHGEGGYTNYACRCGICTAAHSKVSSESRRRRAQRRKEKA